MKIPLYTYRFFFFTALFFLFSSLVSFGQNPFEIKSRSDQTDIETNSEDAIKESTGNPFDLGQSPYDQRYQSKPPTEIKRNVNDPSKSLSRPWKIGFLLFSTMFFVLLRTMNHKGFMGIFKSLISSNKLVEYKNSVNGLFNAQIGLFYLFFVGNLAYFLYLIIQHKGLQIPVLLGNTFLTLALGIMAVYIVKYLTLFILEYGMSIRRVISHHIFSISIHNLVLGCVLFFINVFMAFTTGGSFTFFMWVGIVMIGIFFLVRQVKGAFLMGELRHFSMFHFFIYLCSCEISPPCYWV